MTKATVTTTKRRKTAKTIPFPAGQADEPPAAPTGQAERPIGVFDPAHPWPIGSVIRMEAGYELLLQDLGPSDAEFTIRRPYGGDETHWGATAWNRDMAGQVVEIVFPKGEKATRPARLGAEVPRTSDVTDHEANDTIAEPQPATRNSQAKATPRANLVMVPLDAIDITANIRTSMDEGFLTGLMDSIKDMGVLEPILLRKDGKRFRVVAGHQRLEAAKRAGEAFIEAKVFTDVDDRWEARARLAENVQRQDLNHIDLARVFGQARDSGMSVGDIAQQAHLSDDMVRRHLSLLRLAEPVRQLVASGRLPIHQAELISRVGDPNEQLELTGDCVNMEWDERKKAWRRKAYITDVADDYVCSMGGMRERVAHAMLSLASCGWPKAEEFAKQRPCDGCPDNTATYADQPTLFAGINPRGSDKKGYCSNKTCYEAKLAKWDAVRGERKVEQQRKLAEKIKKARKAGLAVCACGYIADEGEKFVDGRCQKCAAKDAKRQARRTGKPAREFPKTDPEKLAVATAEHGKNLLEAIKEWGEGQEKIISPDAEFLGMVGDLLALQVVEGRCWGWLRDNFARVDLEIPVKAYDPTETLKSRLEDDKTLSRNRRGLLASLASMRFPARPDYQSYQDKVDDVPIPPKAMAFLDCVEAFCRRYGILVPARPTLETIATAGIRKRIIEGNRKDSLAAISECTGIAFLSSITQVPPAAGGVAKLATYKAKAIAARIAELQAQPASTNKADTKQDDGAAAKKQLTTIATGNKAAALAALGQCNDLDGLVQLSNLKGDWRRAAVANRIIKIQKETETT